MQSVYPLILAAGLSLSPLMAGADAPASDPGLEPVPLNSDPGPAYGNETRPFQGIPGIARSPGGRLWATWYGGGTDEGPDNYVMLATSSDNGTTWSTVRYVVDPPGPVRTFDPNLWLDPTGRLWWSHAQSNGFWDGRGGVWTRIAADPDSPQPHWSPARRIADGVMINKPTVLRDGRWLFPIASWQRAPHLNVPSSIVYQTLDQGASFQRLGAVLTPNVVYDEHMIVERQDQSLWMLIRTRTGIAQSVSKDGGHTWSAGEPSPIPHVGSRFWICRLQSGHLLLVKQNPRLDAVWAGGSSPAAVAMQRSRLTAYLSDDDGRKWHGGLVLDERDGVSYPDGVQGPDGLIYVIYDHNRKQEKEILLVRFTEADVLRGSLADGQEIHPSLVNKATGVKKP